ncbi:uncharacterized protein MELLADRAFT_88300 [Melampsora larici-populina 98AG31]|uniref:Uncharacterized protein n=1 Tax=Melampsora larici-populina (strain 98AG31 / pathotype 3-4-7) TaxID=747676 RepID=F4RRA6_MELLP|nr:uncharacterized protein MELLADRAFT_88300 [Melampsora larici-populina 98AG31]EGG05181.1 hypothetical protein MELLADRAFT_88300 [Melampsora larici-populina 98AG31]
MKSIHDLYLICRSSGDKTTLICSFCQPTTDIPEQPSIALENFTKQLTGIFLKAFTQAANSKDEATTN